VNEFPHYFKALPPGCTHVDVYRVLDLFGVVDPPIQHAVKKLLCAGERGGGKTMPQDIAEAIATLQRWQQMRAEEQPAKCECGDREALLCPGAWDPGCEFARGLESLRASAAQPSPAEDKMPHIAPWPDFAGKLIREGDWIVHPSGERARVRLDPSEKSSPGWSEWRCDYEDGEQGLALALQIGDRGMAVVEVEKPAEDPERAARAERWANAPADATHLAECSTGACWWHSQEPGLRSAGDWTGGTLDYAGQNLLGRVACEPRPDVQP
jgi:hypothetical protein